MDHRGRSHYYEDTYRPRHRSLGRQAIDKLEDAMENLKLDRGTNALEVIPYHAGRPQHRSPTPHHSSRRHRSPTPHHSSSHHHHTTSSHHRHRSPSRHRHHDSHYHQSSRRYHSSSPTRHYSTHRGRTSHHDTSSSSRSRSRHWSHGLQASVEAAAIEAYRLRNEPGGWKGAKAGRVATAALSAGVIGAATEHRRERRYDGDDDYGGKKGALGAAIGGLAVNRLVNGPRREVR